MSYPVASITQHIPTLRQYWKAGSTTPCFSTTHCIVPYACSVPSIAERVRSTIGSESVAR
eukprot:351233-Rhodomonas_salina.1